MQQEVVTTHPLKNQTDQLDLSSVVVNWKGFDQIKFCGPIFQEYYVVAAPFTDIVKTLYQRRVHLCDGICYTYFLISINIEDNYTVITILGQTPPDNAP